MPRTRLALCVMLATTLPALSPARAQRTGSAKVDILAKSAASWNGERDNGYPKTQPGRTVPKMTIPANPARPWHTHPIPNAGYILQGQRTIEDKAIGRRQTLRIAQRFTESVDDVYRGDSGAIPTVLITYSGTPGMAMFEAEPAQKPEC